jgi:hypothetical protein
MGSTSQIKNSFSFNRGFITEASALTFPENASLDEENFNIEVDGTRTKRLGFDYEDNFTYIQGPLKTDYTLGTIDTYVWNSPAEQGGVSLLVVQIGETISFFDISDGSQPSSANKLATELSLNSFTPSWLTFVDKNILTTSFADGKGFLFINTINTLPLYCAYDPITQVVTPVSYDIFVRDTSGVEDNLEVDERPITLSPEHEYNLRNQGWPEVYGCTDQSDGDNGRDTTDPVLFTKTVTNAQNTPPGTAGWYPSNADTIYTSPVTIANKSSAVGTYFPPNLLITQFGSSLVPRGKYIVNAFYNNRTDVSGIPGLDDEIKPLMPSSVAFYSGRVFSGSGSDVFYSQILTDIGKVSACHTEQDPSAEILNDVLATDGGVIRIPDAGQILQMISMGGALVVFATEGVWQIDGATDPFSATNNRVAQVSTIGVNNSRSAVLAEDKILFTASTGLYAIQMDKASLSMTVQNVSETTISEYYFRELASNSIPNKSVYDPVGRKIYWLYTNDSELGVHYHDILIFDVLLTAFTKLRLADDDQVIAPFLVSAYITPDASLVLSEEVLETIGGDSVTNNALEDLTAIATAITRRPSSIEFLVMEDIADPNNLFYSMASIRDTDMVDWASSDAGEQPYEAFLLTGYDTGQDLMHYKQAPVIQMAFNRTEEQVVDNGLGGAEVNFPSSCLMSAYWDWTDNATSGKVTNETQVYRYKRPAIGGNIGQALDNGYPIVTTRTKIRGRGRSVHLKLRSEAGKHCEVLGWALMMTGKS